MPSPGLWKYIETELQTNCFYLVLKVSVKNKKRSETSLLASFSSLFWKKKIYFVVLYELFKFHNLVPFALCNTCNTCIAIVC